VRHESGRQRNILAKKSHTFRPEKIFLRAP
jgi:hypothetical protein